MKLAFQFGSHPELSYAELISRFPELKGGRRVAGRFYIIECSENPAWLMEQLGGIVKILEVVEDASSDAVWLADHIVRQCTEKNKVTFGVSLINADKFQGIDLDIKRAIATQSGRPVRAVTSRTPELSSASVHLEKLFPPHGVELVLIGEPSAPLVLQTAAIQAFEDWSFRDYGRPGRDAKRGMLPPKLAKIMINLALGTKNPPDAVLYDPFCGSGTVLTEAALLGIGTVYGSDISKQAVDDTKQSLAWAKKQFDLQFVTDVFKHDATEEASHIKPRSVDVVVAESFLGRPLKPGEQLSQDEKDALVVLYRKTLRALRRVLAPDATVVLALPFQINPQELLPITTILKDTGYTIDPLLPEQDTLLYARANQRTGRHIIRLKK